MMPSACESSAAMAIDHAKRALPVRPPIRGRAKCNPDRFAGGLEPPLDELLGDPILGRLLARDGIAMDDLLALITDVQHALKRR
jgi:hypothetical protein